MNRLRLLFATLPSALASSPLDGFLVDNTLLAVRSLVDKLASSFKPFRALGKSAFNASPSRETCFSLEAFSFRSDDSSLALSLFTFLFFIDISHLIQK